MVHSRQDSTENALGGHAAMTILITGGAGYIGSHMACELLDAGEKFVVLDDLSTGFQWLLPPHVPFIKGNVGDPALLSNIFKQHDVDSIIHIAASIVASQSIADPLSYYRNNTINSHALIACAVEHGIRHFIFSSTSAVYGSAAPTPTTEDAATEPESPYGWSKLMTEQILRDAANASGLRYAILRYFNACGADPGLRTGQATTNADHLIKIAVQTGLGKRQSIEVFGTDYPTSDGTCIRDYIHVSDLVAVHADALRYLREGGVSQILNCGYGKGHSVLQVIETVKRVIGSDFEVKQAPRRPGDRPASIAASDRIRSLLAWKPRYDNLDTIVAHAVAWERHLATRDNTPAHR
jgi:UDP-glucose 4-epimerase